MKKIFRLASVLALAGVALMYTGCTKDYDADIKAIKTDLADLQSGTITNQSQQIAALQAQAASLQTIAGQFQQTLDGLQAAKADKTAVAADKAELLKKISEMEVSISKQISEINAAIADINEIIATKADKSWVEQTFATKTALATVESTLGSVEGRVSAIEGKLANLGVDLDEVEKTLDKVSLTATKAAADATAALGEIDAVKQSLENYYKKGEVVALIEEAKTELQGQIEALDKSKESKEDAAKTRSELLAKIKTLQSNHQSLMKFTNSLSDSVDVRFDRVNLELTALAAKIAGVEKAYKEADEALEKAYKNADEEINKEIEKLQNALKDEIAAREKALEEEIEARKNAIDEEAAQRAGADSTEVAERKAAILQEIADRKQAVSDAIKYLNDSIDQEIADRKAAIETEANARREAIKAVQDSLDNACEMIKANKLSIDQEIANREQAIIDLNNKLTAYSDSLKNHVETEILGLSKRIKSVSVYPTKNPELVRYVVGNDSSLVLITTFQVKPASAAKNITADQLKLFYGYATERGTGRNTRAQLVNKKSVTIEDANGFGLIKVKAVKLAEDTKNILDATDANQLFFALEITDQDTVGEYTIMSEYQNPVYGKSYNLDTAFTANAYSVNAKHQEYTKSDIDYTLCKDALINPVFPTAKIMVEYTRPDKATEIVSIDDFQKFSGMKFNVSDTVYIRTEHANGLPNDSCLVLKPDANQALKTRARFKNNTAEATFKLYVGEVDTVVYHPTINGKDVDVEFRHAFEIIKHIKAEVTKNFRVYWNYINYDSDNYGRSKDTLKYDTLIVNEPTTKTSLDWWSYCIKQNALYAGGNNNDKTQPLKLQGKSTFLFWDYSAQDPKAYYGNLYVAYARFQSKAQHYEDVLKKEDTYNRYNFNISVDIDSIPVIAEETFTKADSIGVTVTKTNTVKFSKAIVGEPFIGNKDAVKPYLIAGLDSYDFNAISNKFFMNGNFVVDKVVRLKPTTHSTKPYDTLVIDNAKLAISADNSDVKLAFDKMTLMPNSKYIVNAHKTVFGLDYKMVFVFETKKSSIVLVTTSYIKTAAETDALRSSTSDKEIFAGTMGAEAKGRINPTTLYNESQYESYYSLEDNAIQQYLRAEQAYKLSTEEDYSQYSVSYQYEMAQAAGTALLPIVPDSSKITKQANKTEMLLSALNSTKPNQDIKWNDYTGRVLKITAILWVNDEAVDSKTFILWTKTPVILKAVSNVNTPIKKAGESLSVKLDKYVSVNGLVEGLEVEKNVYDVTGTNKLLYQKYFSRNDGYSTDHSKFFTYSIDETKVTFDGKPYDFRSGNDYSFDATTAELTIFKNNVIGELIIPIKVSMNYYLDYNHNTSYSYGVQTKEIEVKIKVTE